MLILKKINNNVALAASDDGREVVVFGKGIGFHEMPYELADESLIQRKFYNVPESLQDMVGTLPDDVLLAASDIACFASQQLGCKLSGGLPFILADHLQFAVQRDDDQLSAPNPLEHEVAFIYPRELEIGQAALAIVQSTPAPSWVRTRPRASRSTSLTPRSMAWVAPRTWISS